MIRVARPRQCFCGALPELRLDCPPFGTQLGEVELVRPNPRNDDEVDTGGQELRPMAEALTAEPLYAVSAHGASDLRRDDQTEPGRTRHVAHPRLGRHQQSEMGRPHAAPRSLRTHKFRVLAQPAIVPKLQRHYFL
jgi:hypothetical protein